MIIPTPRVYLGTMTFGWSQASSVVDEIVAKSMVDSFIVFNKKTSTNKHYIDTARIYAGGATEPIVGTAIVDHDQSSLCIGTKAHPSQEYGLSAKGIQQQFEASIKAMNVDAVEEFYLHQPDTEHSLFESLQCVDSLIKDNKVQKLGMSNYHVDEIRRAFELCDEYGFAKPSIYQGLYNPLNRAVEDELISLLKENDCSFVAYNPLAAGLLTGKHKGLSEVADGRFKNNQNYLPRFYTDANFEALDIITKACEKEEITLLEATFRWLLQHSALEEKDGVLLGASSMDQLNQNFDACQVAKMDSGALSVDIQNAFDDAWEVTKSSAFPYWRSYSSDMPNRDTLDHGASYSAAKK